MSILMFLIKELVLQLLMARPITLILRISLEDSQMESKALLRIFMLRLFMEETKLERLFINVTPI